MDILRILRELKHTGAAVKNAAPILARETPVAVLFFDGVTRSIPHITSRLHYLWTHFPNLRKESAHVYEHYRGGDFIDVGAFHGWYSLLLSCKARPGATFVSFEPDSRAMPRLLKTLSVVQNLFPAVRFCMNDAACGNGHAITRFMPMGEDGHPKFESFTPSEPDNDAPMKAVRLDDFVAALGLKPCLIKVDVEGAEFHVLQGMEQVLTSFRPTLLLEVHPQWQPEGITVDTIRNLLLAKNYTITVIDTSAIAERWLVT